MGKKFVISALLIFPIFFTNCSIERIIGYLQGSGSTGSYTIRNLPRGLTPEEVKLSSSINSFGLKLFTEIVRHPEEKDKNIFISPLSVSMALGMTYNGADGTTEQAMRNTLGYGNMTTNEINQAYRDLIDMIVSLDPLVEMQIANSIWYRKGFQVEQDFIDINKSFFDAVVRELDFSNPGAKDVINAWVDEKTNGKIPVIVDNISPEIVMFLINAVYFKGSWTEQFDPSRTYDGAFFLPDGSRKTVKMMFRDSGINYYFDKDFQAVDLHYGGKAFSMTILLPRKNLHVDDLISSIDTEKLDEFLSSFSESDIQLSMPKFKLEYDLTMNDVLKALGMEVAFDPLNADFTKINRLGELYIDKVKHKTFVDVNEGGTEAAGVTSVGIGTTSVPPQMIVNRPFVFLIREKFSNTILFIGKIVEPVLE